MTTAPPGITRAVLVKPLYPKDHPEDPESFDPLSSKRAWGFQTPADFKAHAKTCKAYANWSVISCTRYKDLESETYHEFLGFLVFNQQANSYSKIYSERGRHADFTSVGKINMIPSIERRAGTGTGPRLVHVLPLQTLAFDEHNRPTILQIAETLEKTHDVHPDYTKWLYHCYWYATTNLYALKKMFPTSKLKNWTFWSTHNYLLKAVGAGNVVSDILATSIDDLPDKQQSSLEKFINFDPSRFSNMKANHVARHETIKDIFADKNEPQRKEWQATLQLEPDPELESEPVGLPTAMTLTFASRLT